MFEEKKKYLNSYLLQEAKINRLNKMSAINPDDKEMYKELVNDAVKTRSDIERKIKAVDDELLSELLFQKYVFGQTLEQISYILNYSKRHTERLHRKALEKFKM